MMVKQQQDGLQLDNHGGLHLGKHNGLRMDKHDGQQKGSEIQWWELEDDLEQIDFPMGVYDLHDAHVHIPAKKRFRRLKSRVCRRTVSIIFNIGISVGVIIALTLASLAWTRVGEEHMKKAKDFTVGVNADTSPVISSSDQAAKSNSSSDQAATRFDLELEEDATVTINHSNLEVLKNHSFLENNQTEDAEQMQKESRFQDDGMNQRFKIRQKALKYEQMRMSDRVVVLPEANPTPEIEDLQKEGSTVEMELMRQERSQKDASD